LRRTTFKLLGFGCVAIGIVGIILPVLPSTIFFILAAGAFARSSPELEQRILEDPRIGPPVRNWRDHGIVPVRAKIYALAGMAAGYVIFYWTTDPDIWLAFLVGAIIALSALYVVSRPSVIKEAG
jgi:uncharacterized membrane protein YbaN (DUF454 family)